MLVKREKGPRSCEYNQQLEPSIITLFCRRRSVRSVEYAYKTCIQKLGVNDFPQRMQGQRDERDKPSRRTGGRMNQVKKRKTKIEKKSTQVSS